MYSMPSHHTYHNSFPPPLTPRLPSTVVAPGPHRPCARFSSGTSAEGVREQRKEILSKGREEKMSSFHLRNCYTSEQDRASRSPHHQFLTGPGLEGLPVRIPSFLHEVGATGLRQAWPFSQKNPTRMNPVHRQLFFYFIIC